MKSKKIVLWLDDERNPRSYYDNENYDVTWCKSVNDAIDKYLFLKDLNIAMIIDLDHDAGDYAAEGGDYIKFLDWMEEHYPNDMQTISWKVHSMNIIGIQNMFRILNRNGVY